MNRANNFTYVTFLVIIIVTILFVPSGGQVTFSKDWNAGKRSIGSVECRSNIKSATAFCRMLVSGMRQLSGCEARSEEDNLNAANIFPGKR